MLRIKLVLVLTMMIVGSNLTAQEFKNDPYPENNTELLPLDPEDLETITDSADRWRRRRPSKPVKPPINEPIEDRPIERRPIVDQPDIGEYPRLKMFFEWILNIPIILEIRQLISSMFSVISLFAIWFLPIYLFGYRFVWPLDILMKIGKTMKELSKNTKRPFDPDEDEDEDNEVE